jgi:hypothetical protein
MKSVRLRQTVASVIVTLVAAGAIVTVAKVSNSEVVYASETAAATSVTEVEAPKNSIVLMDRKIRASSRDYNRKPVLGCKNNLAQVLFRAGFRGENLREAWSIAMRESNGESIGPGDYRFNGSDWGIVQFNKPTWGDQDWWSDSRILDPAYSARIMFRISDGGRTWQMWGLTGSGRLDTSMYGGWSADQQWSWIMEPYLRWYDKYPC